MLLGQRFQKQVEAGPQISIIDHWLDLFELIFQRTYIRGIGKI